MWSVNTPHYSFHHKVGEHNYCRSPDGDDHPWCYTTDPTKGWEHCAVPECLKESENCIPTDGTVYTGNTNTTAEGRTCQMWSVNTPHNHSLMGIGEHNYCRSPNGDEQVWCFTKDPKKRWEYCNVPACSTKTQSAEEIGCTPRFPDGTAYTGHLNTTVNGRTCQMWSVDTPHVHRFATVGEHNYCRDPAGIGLLCYTTDPEKEWEFCDVPLCVAPKQSVEDIGCEPTDGTAYTGKANTTASGRVCQMWSVDTPHDSYHPEVGEHNYCRNPDDDDFGLWCYTTDPKIGVDYCEIPYCVTVDNLDCLTTDGSTYTGNLTTTKSGKTCQMWTVQTPHSHSYTHIGEHNYCRDPDDDGPWCYTTDVKMRWDRCNVPVPLCVTYTKGIVTQI